MRQKYRLRIKGETKKGKKFVIERKDILKGKWESRTLNPDLALWNYACQDTINRNVSEKPIDKDAKVPQTFGYGQLNEPTKSDTLPVITEKQKRELWEMSK